MSTAELDDASGRLVLSLDAFEALVAIASGQQPERSAALDALERAGVVQGSSIHPLVAPAAGTVADPVVRGEIDLVQVDTPGIRGQVWVGSEATVLLLPVGDAGDRQVFTTATAQLPATVARIVGLRPQPRLGSEGMRLPSDMLETVLSGSPEERERVVDVVLTQVDHDATRSFLSSLVDEPWWYWSLELTWPPAAGVDGERSLHVLDTVGGFAIMASDQGSVILEPTTPTDLWAYLSVMLPTDAELAWAVPAGP